VHAEIDFISITPVIQIQDPGDRCFRDHLSTAANHTLDPIRILESFVTGHRNQPISVHGDTGVSHNQIVAEDGGNSQNKKEQSRNTGYLVEA
jgi:hypothetical protein